MENESERHGHTELFLSSHLSLSLTLSLLDSSHPLLLPKLYSSLCSSSCHLCPLASSPVYLIHLLPHKPSQTTPSSVSQLLRISHTFIICCCHSSILQDILLDLKKVAAPLWVPTYCCCFFQKKKSFLKLSAHSVFYMPCKI